MRKITSIHTVNQHNYIIGNRTLHPLVSVIDLSQVNMEDFVTLQVGFYCVILKEYTCQYFAFGRKEYDYSDGTILFLSPGETISMEENHEVEMSRGWLLAFHPDLLRGTHLNTHINDYNFLYFKNEEALHVSIREKKVFMQCLQHINEELHHSIDKYSRGLVVKSIDLLLSYCARFYERQFITRSEANKQLIKQTEYIVTDFYDHPKSKIRSFPSAKYCANLLYISPAYFIELLRLETGFTVNEYMQHQRMEIAKKWLRYSNKTVPEVAIMLGFSSTVYFSCLFEKLIGIAPKEYGVQK